MSIDIKDDTIARVRAEVRRARSMFPHSDNLFCILVEEVGELAKALQDESADRVRDEATQVVAMAIRCLEEGDPSFGVMRDRKGLDPV